MPQINLKIKSDFAQASKDLKKFGTVTEAQRKQIEKYQKSFKTQSVDKFIDANRRLGAGIKANKGDINSIITQQKALERQSINLIKKGLDPQDKAVEKLSDEYNRLQKEYDQTITKTKAMTDATKLASKGLLIVAAATAAVAVKGSQEFKEYSESIANVNTLIAISEEEFKALDKSLGNVSKEFAVQKKDLSAGVYQALSAGAEDLGAALDIVENSTVLAKGALIDNAQAVDIVTTAMNAYGADVVNAAQATDVFFTIVKEGKITGDELSQTIGKSISLFEAAKLPIEELGAGIATLTKVGIPAAEATTQLNGIVNAFIKPSEALTAAVKEYGFASGSALLESEGFGGALEFLQQASDGSLESLGELVPNIRGLRGALAAGKDEGVVFNEVLSNFENISGAATEAALRQTDGFAKAAFEFDQAKIELQNMRIEIGEKMLPIFVKLIQSVDDALPLIFSLTAGMAAFVAIAKSGAVINNMRTAIVGLNAVFTSTAGVVGLVVAGTVALVLAIKKIDDKKVEKLKDAYGDISDDTGIAVKDLGKMSTKTATLLKNADNAQEAFELLSELSGLTDENLAKMIVNTDSIDEKSKEYSQNLLVQLETFRQMDAAGIKLLEIAEDELQIAEDKQKVLDQELKAKTQLYLDQDKAVQAILESNKTEVELIDEQIAGITELALKQSGFKDDQTKAVEILKAKKKEIVDADLKAITDVRDAESKAITDSHNEWITNLLTQKDDKFLLLDKARDKAIANEEEIGGSTVLIEKFYDNEKLKLTEDLENEKKAITQAGFDSFISITNTSLDLFGSLLDGFQKEDLAQFATSISAIGLAMGNPYVAGAGAIIGVFDKIFNSGKETSKKTAEAFSEQIKKIKEDYIALGDKIFDINEDIAKSHLTFEEETINRISDRNQIRINEAEKAFYIEKGFIESLSDSELSRLGFADELNSRKLEEFEIDSDAYNLEKERQAFEKQRLDEEAFRQENLLKIEKARFEIEKKRELIDLKKDLKETSEDISGQRAVLERSIVGKESAFSSSVSAGNINEALRVEKEKEVLVAQLASMLTEAEATKDLREFINLLETTGFEGETITPTAQTGTPMGGFTVPDNPRSSRADSVGLNVSPGENVQVTPRGETGGQALSVGVDLNGDTLIDFFNDKIESGDIRITVNNIQDGGAA